MKKPFITFQNFTFTYSDQTVPILNELNVTINEGEKILVIGPSGSGKSTFARCLSGVLPNKDNNDFSGKIIIGEDINNPIISNFLPNELAISMLESAATIHEKNKGQTVQPAVEPFQTYLEQKKLASMEWFLSKYPSLKESYNMISDSQFEKMKSAGFFIDDKPVLILDEPLANLDPKSGDIAMKFIDELAKQTDTTIIIIEHRLEDALAYPIERLILLSEGRLMADGKPSDILKTDVLGEIGIREPLYITAMRYAGVNLDTVNNLDDVHKINGPNLKEQMELWLSYLPQFQYREQLKPLMELRDINFQYPWNERPILKNVSLKINQGEMVSLVGPNGSGKTTLSKLISGEEAVQEGQMLWKGEDVSSYNADELAVCIGYVPQNPLESISQPTIVDELAYRLRNRNFSEQEISKRIEKVIRICSLQYIRDLPIAALSFGQLRRVAIGSVLVLDPELIIVDEPAAGQDLNSYIEIMNFLQSINLRGVSVLLVTHDIHLMLEYTKRAIVMAEGEVIADASPVMVLATPEIVAAASLKETNLLTFAKQINMTDPYAFTDKFIHYDRVARLF
ncbi:MULTISPECIES: ABC transporter ATP-binding protein [unclassified Jeotgalibaca]|uniref:ABC transporter ATP-binding protein n=1 Tax=unclassified Jeotgalibaca TaxID=2621505 RepID=UPI003FD2D83F